MSGAHTSAVAPDTGCSVLWGFRFGCLAHCLGTLDGQSVVGRCPAWAFLLTYPLTWRCSGSALPCCCCGDLVVVWCATHSLARVGAAREQETEAAVVWGWEGTQGAGVLLARCSMQVYLVMRC